MRKYQKGIVFLPFLIIVILIFAVGFIAYNKSQSQTISVPHSTPTIHPVQTQNNIPFEIIAEGSLSEKTYQEVAKINNFGELNCMVLRSFTGTSRILSYFLNEDKIESLDLDHHVYVIIGQGVKPTTQFYTKIEDVYIKEEENEVLVEASFKDDGPPAEGQTRPFIIIGIDKTMKMDDVREGYTFVVKESGKDVCRKSPAWSEPQ